MNSNKNVEIYLLQVTRLNLNTWTLDQTRRRRLKVGKPTPRTSLWITFDIYELTEARSVTRLAKFRHVGKVLKVFGQFLLRFT